MGFTSGRITFRRFYLAGQHPKSLSDEWLAAIAARAFGKQGEIFSDGTETGWIVPSHLFDVDFSTPERITLGRFVYLAMRLDRTAPPSAIVQSYRKMEEAAALRASGRDYLNRTERRLAKEAALGRAEKEAREGRFRRTTAYPVLIDLQRGVVYFGNLGATAGDGLMTLFADTFGVTLVPVTAEEAAYRAAEKYGFSQAYEEAQPAHFVDPPAVSAETVSAALPGQDRSFVGREFLTWLWFRTESGEGLFEPGHNGTITVAMDRLIHLECSYDLTGTATIRTDVPASSPEARAALRIGKVPTKMGLLIGTATEEWTLTLDGPHYTVSGLQVPRAEEDDPRASLVCRFGQIGELGAVLDQLFVLFLRCRLKNGWSEEYADICRWARDHRSEAADDGRRHRATA